MDLAAPTSPTAPTAAGSLPAGFDGIVRGLGRRLRRAPPLDVGTHGRALGDRLGGRLRASGDRQQSMARPSSGRSAMRATGGCSRSRARTCPAASAGAAFEPGGDPHPARRPRLGRSRSGTPGCRAMPSALNLSPPTRTVGQPSASRRRDPGLGDGRGRLARVRCDDRRRTPERSSSMSDGLPIWNLEASPDGRAIAAIGYDKAWVWDADSGQAVRIPTESAAGGRVAARWPTVRGLGHGYGDDPGLRPFRQRCCRRAPVMSGMRRVPWT